MDFSSIAVSAQQVHGGQPKKEKEKKEKKHKKHKKHHKKEKKHHNKGGHSFTVSTSGNWHGILCLDILCGCDC